MWVIFPILGYVPIFHGLWVIRTVGCFPCGLYSYPSKKIRIKQSRVKMMATISTPVVKELSRAFSKLGQGSFEHSLPNLGRFGTISRVLIIIK